MALHSLFAGSDIGLELRGVYHLHDLQQEATGHSSKSLHTETQRVVHFAKACHTASGSLRLKATVPRPICTPEGIQVGIALGRKTIRSRVPTSHHA